MNGAEQVTLMRELLGAPATPSARAWDRMTRGDRRVLLMSAELETLDYLGHAWDAIPYSHRARICDAAQRASNWAKLLGAPDAQGDVTE